MMFSLAERNAIPLRFADVDALRRAYHFDHLQGFLDLYYQGMGVLRTEQDFYDLTRAYLDRAHRERVLRAEMFFDPQAHVVRGVELARVVDGISGAMVDAQREWGLSSGLIFSFLRHLPVADAEAIFEQALPLLDRFIAVGLDSSERGNPPGPFAALYQRARGQGLFTVAHAGEEGSADYVWQALERLKVNRIDHGNRALEDEALVQELVRRQTPLTLCPLSNLALGGVGDLSAHPLKQMLDLGLNVSVHSDDPAYFGGYINANYSAAAAALVIERPQLLQLARNSFNAAFASPERVEGWLSQLDEYSRQQA